MLSFHGLKFVGSPCASGVSVRFSGFLPLSKVMCNRLTDIPKWPVVCECVCVCVPGILSKVSPVLCTLPESPGSTQPCRIRDLENGWIVSI